MRSAEGLWGASDGCDLQGRQTAREWTPRGGATAEKPNRQGRRRAALSLIDAEYRGASSFTSESVGKSSDPGDTEPRRRVAGVSSAPHVPIALRSQLPRLDSNQ
jgi:hypothetical protein